MLYLNHIFVNGAIDKNLTKELDTDIYLLDNNNIYKYTLKIITFGRGKNEGCVSSFSHKRVATIREFWIPNTTSLP
jgi:hypothetical protein